MWINNVVRPHPWMAFGVSIHSSDGPRRSFGILNYVLCSLTLSNDLFCLLGVLHGEKEEERGDITAWLCIVATAQLVSVMRAQRRSCRKECHAGTTSGVMQLSLTI